VFKFNNINIRRKDKPFYSYFQILLIEFEFIPHAPGACPHDYDLTKDFPENMLE
jgi:hypothetical protein